MEVLAKDAARFVSAAAPTEDKIAKMENEANEAVKSALLISEANKPNTDDSKINSPTTICWVCTSTPTPTRRECKL